jgi:hypothetical protein
VYGQREKEKRDKKKKKKFVAVLSMSRDERRDRRRPGMVSGVKIQAFSRRHVRRERQGTDAYYKSRRGPVRKGNVGGKERGEKMRPTGMRSERKDRTRGGVWTGVYGHDRISLDGIYDVPP